MAATACLPRCPYDRRTCSVLGIAAIGLGTLAVAGLGGLITAEPVQNWYPTIAKPSWTPPDWLFGPVWTALFILMAMAASLVWVRRDNGCDVCAPMGLYAVQLTANLAWCVLFFGLRSPWLGFLDVVLLWAAVGVMMVTFFQVRAAAGWLVAPYWLWVTFAAVLNGSIVVMSP